MSADNKHKIYTAADIERYHKGLMNPAERHALEKAALDDQFLAEAIEGYAIAEDVAGDTLELRNRLSKRLGEAEVIPIVTRKKESFRWMRVAAMIIVLAGGAILASQFLFNKKDNEIAKNDQPVKDTGRSTVAKDSAHPEVASPTTNAVSDTKTGAVSIQENNPADVSKGLVTEEGRKEIATAPVVSKEPVTLQKDVPEQKNEYTSIEEDKKKEQVARLSKPVAENAGQNQKTAAAQTRSAEKYRDDQLVNVFRGKVTDESNRGLPFANVTNTRDNVGTYTDVSGNFVLTSPDTVLDVQIRSLGYDNNVQQLRRSAVTNNVVMQDNVDGVTETIVSRNNSNAMRRQIDNNMKVEEPEPADGWDNYDVYLANNLNIPTEFKPRPSAPQEVELSFEVNKQGEPVNIRVEKSLCNSCDQEAIRLVKEGPKWKRNAKKRTRLTVAF